MQICMHPFCGPIPQNAVYGSWKITHTVSCEDIAPLTIYADDETGDLWRFVETRAGIARLPAGAPEVEQDARELIGRCSKGRVAEIDRLAGALGTAEDARHLP